MSITVEQVLPILSGKDTWKAAFEIQLTDSGGQPVGEKLQFDGKFTTDGQTYFWGFGPEQNTEGWVFRLDFQRSDFVPGVPYTVGSGGFWALLIQGGGQMISGGLVIGGTMHIDEMDPDHGRVRGRFENVVTERGGRPDGSEMEPAYASRITFVCEGGTLEMPAR
ncbi:hypothetical protein ACIP66_10255 [Pseudomonas sp. NPDC088429]|uniref:hypothetical protein n=1 Tax=Pseudomonas sp. NPDC088429 TaxID=3364455 RepID=UPI003813CEC9